jgi:outer membrane lipoprotein SlyB
MYFSRNNKQFNERRFGMRTISVLIVFVMLIGSCASIPEEHRGAATGAGVGAVAGATAGALLGSKGAKTEMAIVGGLLGALAGGVIGHYAYDKKRSEAETYDKYNYKTTSGTMVRIEEADTVPATVRPGDTVDLRMTYALLGTGRETTVTETREILYEGELFGKPQVNVKKNDGTYSSTIPITLPGDAKRGKYTVVFSAQTANAGDSKGTSFYVQ